jgi:hypothetical protein
MLKSPFLSRVGLIENLRNHLLAGKSAAMVGGPMIGKSILAQNLADQIRERGAIPILVPLKKVVSPGALWSLLMETILYQGIGPGRKNPYRKNPETLPELMTQLHHLYEKVPSEMAARPLVFLLDDAETLLPFSDDLIPQIVNSIPFPSFRSGRPKRLLKNSSDQNILRRKRSGSGPKRGDIPICWKKRSIQKKKMSSIPFLIAFCSRFGPLKGRF